MMGIDARVLERFPFLHVGCKVMLYRGHFSTQGWREARVYSVGSDGRVGICLSSDRLALDWYLEATDEVRLIDGQTAIPDLIKAFLYARPSNPHIENALIKAVKGAIDVFDQSNSVPASKTPSREVPVKVHEHSGRKVEERVFAGKPTISISFRNN